MEQKVYESLEKVQNAVLRKGYENVFLVRGRRSFGLSGAEDRLKDLFLNKNVSQFYFFDSNPRFEDMMNGIRVYDAVKPDVVVAVGGGSVIDMAKLVKGLAWEENPRNCILENRIKGDKVVGDEVCENRVDFFAVPTTAGSGAESTPFAVVYVDGKKYSLEDETLLPNGIALDARLTDNLGREQRAVSGMDALCQAVESYWSVNSTEESKRYSTQALRIILKNLEFSVNSRDLESNKKMLHGANLAGRAIAIAKTTACHSISYPMTSRFGVKHGHAVALSLGEVFQYNCVMSNEECVDKRGGFYVRGSMDELCDLFEVSTGMEANRKIQKLMERIGLERRLSKLGVEIDVVVREGFNPQRMKNNPKRIEESDLREILERIY